MPPVEDDKSYLWVSRPPEYADRISIFTAICNCFYWHLSTNINPPLPFEKFQTQLILIDVLRDYSFIQW